MYCKLCMNPKWSTTVTSNARDHLASKYHITIEATELKGKKACQLALDISFQHTIKRQQNRDDKKEREILKAAIDKDAFYEVQIQLITYYCLSFNCIEWSKYQVLLMSVNPEVEDFLIKL